MPNYKRYYVRNSMVFITIVTQDRKPILINNIELLKKAIKETRYNYKVVAYIILPNHIHIIIKPESIKEFPKIISSIKHYFSRNCNIINNELRESQVKRREKGIWQRRYYDHIIRDEKDLYKHLDYIHFNSMKHYRINPKNWKFSSFKKFVEFGYYDNDWCNFDDLNEITSMDLE